MADSENEKPASDATPEIKPETPPAEAKPAEAKSDLPVVDSPPLSPAADPAPAEAAKIETPAASAELPAPEPILAAPAENAAVKIEPAVVAETPAPETVALPAAETPSAQRRFALNPRTKRHALLAATVTLAAALGAIFGALATGPAKQSTPDVAALEERKAMQQSIARLSTEIGALKGNLEAANKSANTQLARISERLKRESAEITGSISAPQTVAAAPAAAPAVSAPQTVTTPLLQTVATPLPQPRPTRVAAVEPQRPPVVPGWTIHEVRDGYVYVQGHGDIYRVTPGARLPGLGPVESIKRQDGRWTVLTPKGAIVAGRDRRFFDSY